MGPRGTSQNPDEERGSGEEDPDRENEKEGEDGGRPGDKEEYGRRGRLLLSFLPSYFPSSFPSLPSAFSLSFFMFLKWG